MKRFLQSIALFFARLFGADMWQRLLRGVEIAAPYLEFAYELVSIAAQATPNRTDDELLALARQLGVPAIWQSQDKGAAIRELVAAALRIKWPDLPDRIINRAIELAYGALRP